MLRIASALLVVAGCVHDRAVACDDGRVCPQGDVCDDTHGLCIVQNQLDTCADAADVAACTITIGDEMTPGSCHEQVCLPRSCGNGRIDPAPTADDPMRVEACDDGNTVGGDGCAVDCLSKETCGNRIVDAEVGETCDDGNHLEHDGCSSACAIEQPRWIERGGTPSARQRPAAAYDATRARVVLYGGDDRMTALSTTTTVWEWFNGWVEQPFTAAPSPRHAPAMAYHQARNALVFYGGDNVTVFGDTWSWNGSGWTQIGDGPRRSNTAMAYDARRKKIVMFGGYSPIGMASSETWEWDGVWTQVTPPTTPPGREGQAMAYDPVRGVIMMYGGSQDTSVLGDFWEYDGVDWKQPVNGGAVTPPPLAQPAMAFDDKHGHIVMFGGFTATGNPTNATYTWATNAMTGATGWFRPPSFAANPPPVRGGAALAASVSGHPILFGGAGIGGALIGDSWTIDNTNAWVRVDKPPGRSFLGMVTDLARDRIVLFGGYAQGGGRNNDTWEWSNEGWQRLDPATTTPPPPMGSFGMAYDETHRATVVFGGNISDTAPMFNGNTYTWSGTTWTKLAPAQTPSPRQRPAMTFDPATRQVLLLGGEVGNSVLLADTWLWNGTTWSQGSNGPAVGWPALGADPIRKQVVAFGGLDDQEQATATTSIWDGASWHTATVANAPPARFGATLTWNPARERLVLTGGLGLPYLDAWEWDGASWSLVPTTALPPISREQSAAAVSFSGTGTIVFGGYDPDNVTLDDLWELRWESSSDSDRCLLAVDLDGDGLAGCDDPDCWPTCTPTCMPGTSCVPTDPHCGDGVCDPRACPGDCP